MLVIKDNLRVPIKSWCESPEEGAINQAKNLANLPFAFRYICLMPDTHQGFGMPIGGVLATENVIIPNCVGSDIGCGMCAIKTNIQDFNKESLTKVIGQIREVVPVGFNRHKFKQNINLIPPVESQFTTENDLRIVRQELDNCLTSVGTLGGGNHFIELQKDKEGFLWVMIHSGSRNIGKKVADYYNNVAKDINQKYFSAVPDAWELAFLPVDSQEGVDYINEMDYCIKFALANRKLMMDNILQVLQSNFNGLRWDEMINIAHNYARMEHHFGRNVMIHRKGATSAKKNEIGIIPGSQGTKSYIVIGKGNEDSFSSCSHGAGRKMGRKQAQRTLNLEAEKAALDAQGIIHAVRTIEDLDESTGSYKSIDTVMAEQNDLVDIMVELTPLGVVKG